MNTRADSKIIIAIDGCSSSGKSTVAREVAQQLAYVYIDTGAMYRAVTLFALRHQIVKNQTMNSEELVSCLDRLLIEFRFNPLLRRNETFLNGENVEEEIRQLPVSSHVSKVATLPEVREAMVKQQRAMGISKGIVMDGRDIGTVVFPGAELKIFMTAGTEERAQRRFLELTAKGQEISYETVLHNIEERDRIDSTRKVGPLRKASDALVLDNTNLTRKEQLNWILDKVVQRIKN